MKRSFVAGLAPRDRSAAARVGGRLTLVAAGMTAAFALFFPPPGGAAARVAAFAVPAALVGFTVPWRRASAT